VRARAQVQSVGKNDVVNVTLSADDGYHINANPDSFDYLIPTVFSIPGASGIRVSYPAATTIKGKFALDGFIGTDQARAIAQISLDRFHLSNSGKLKQ
jgi:hypothetical protein